VCSCQAEQTHNVINCVLVFSSPMCSVLPCMCVFGGLCSDPTLDIDSFDLNQTAISSTLKAFFKLLPDPLISNAIASQILVINCELSLE